MTTTSLPKKTLRFTRFVAAATLLTFGLGSVQAAVISNGQAKSIAKLVAKGGDPVAVMAPYIGAGTNVTAADAAASAIKIVKYLSDKQQRVLAGKIGVGVAYYFPTQISNITLALSQMNSNMRQNAAPWIVFQMANFSGANSGMDARIALQIGQAFAKHNDLAKQASQISDILMLAVINSNDTDTVKAAALGNVAAYLSSELLKGGKHNKISSTQQQMINTVESTFETYLVKVVSRIVAAAVVNNPNISQAELSKLTNDTVSVAVGSLGALAKQGTTGSNASSSNNTTVAAQNLNAQLQTLQKTVPNKVAAGLQKAVTDASGTQQIEGITITTTQIQTIQTLITTITQTLTSTITQVIQQVITTVTTTTTTDTGNVTTPETLVTNH